MTGFGDMWVRPHELLGSSVIVKGKWDVMLEDLRVPRVNQHLEIPLLQG